jgi:hypothetical protein
VKTILNCDLNFSSNTTMGDEVKDDKMGGLCGIWEEEKCIECYGKKPCTKEHL